jgi:hypothetical protein
MSESTNLRALCTELVNELHGYKVFNPSHATELIDRARAELATPPPEPPNLTPILAAILLGRHEPLQWHHASFLTEYFDYPSEDELRNIVLTGVYSTPPPKPPTVEEIDRCIEAWKELCNYHATRDRFKWVYLLDRDDILNAVRAIFERWGQ